MALFELQILSFAITLNFVNTRTSLGEEFDRDNGFMICRVWWTTFPNLVFQHPFLNRFTNFSFRTFHIEFLLNTKHIYVYIFITLQISSKLPESFFSSPQTRLKIKRNTQNPNPISSILLFSHRPFRSSNKQTNQRPLPNQLEKQIPDISRRIESGEGRRR